MPARRAGRRAIADPACTLPGRGAYLCRDGERALPLSDCVARAVRRGGIARALRAKVTLDPKLVESGNPSQSEIMSKKRVHEIAKEQGLSSKELLEKLKAAGIEAKAAASSVEEAAALKALGVAAPLPPRVPTAARRPRRLLPRATAERRTATKSAPPTPAAAAPTSAASAPAAPPTAPASRARRGRRCARAGGRRNRRPGRARARRIGSRRIGRRGRRCRRARASDARLAHR